MPHQEDAQDGRQREQHKAGHRLREQDDPEFELIKSHRSERGHECPILPPARLKASHAG